MSVENDLTQPSLGERIVALSTGIPFAMAYTIVAPILPKMEAALAHSANDAFLVKMAVGINGLSMVVGAPLAGYLTDKISRRQLMAWSFAVFAVVGAWGYFIESLWMMVFTRFVVGVATATCLTVAITMIGDIQNQNTRNHLMGINTAGASVCGIIFLPVVGIMADIYWRTPFWLYLMTLPLAVFAFFVLKDRPKTHVESATDAAANPRLPVPWGLLFLALVVGSINLISVTYTPFAFPELGITSTTIIGSSLAAKAFTLAIASAVFGIARKYMSTNAIFTCAFVCCGIGATMTAMAPSVTVLTIAFLIWGFGLGWFTPPLMVRATETATAGTRGRVVGLVKGVQMMTSFVTVMMFEPLLRWGGPDAVFFATAIIAVLAVVYFMVTPRMRSPVQQAAE